MTMGQRIAEQRKMLGISQEALGERMGVSRQAISKWESDGAVPDIDKLIALSKLFGVTVGWLLGVEEEPDASGFNYEFTEAQLKMVEEIVKRYQPKIVTEEKKSRYRRLIIAAILVAAIILVGVLTDFSSRLSNMDSLISSLNYTYSSIQNQLGILSDRLDELAEGEKLLSDYYAEGEAWDDASGADLTFSLVPKRWDEGYSAAVSVRLGSQEVTSVPCEWDGTVCMAVVPLEAEDGYEYYFVAYYGDGSKEQQWLEDTGYENLSYCLNGSYSITCHNAEISGGYLKFTDSSLDISAPGLGKNYLTLKGIDWVILVNGTEHHREAAFTDWYWDGYDNMVSGGSGLTKFPLPEAKNGDEVLLQAEVFLSDGTSKVVDVLQFTLKDGVWEQTVFAYSDY